MINKKKRALIIGGYGFGNIGDEAILGGLIQKNSSLYDEIKVFSNNPEGTFSLHDVPAEKKNLMGFIKCDELIIGGGELFQDGIAWKNAFAIFFARFLKKKVRVLGVGIDVNGKVERTLTRFSLIMADEISVRDKRSADNLILMDIDPDKIKIVEDLAFNLKPQLTDEMKKFYMDHELSGYEFLILVLRQKNAEIDNKLLTFFSGFVRNQLEKKRNLKIVLIPFGRHPYSFCENDCILLQKLKDNVKNDRLILFNGPFEPAGILWLISKARLVISARLHPLIFSNIARTSAIAIPLFSKTRSHADAYKHQIIELKDIDSLYEVVSGVDHTP